MGLTLSPKLLRSRYNGGTTLATSRHVSGNEQLTQFKQTLALIGNQLPRGCGVVLDGTDGDDLEVELSICPLRIDPNLCDRTLCLAARANL